jgi:hypothetical protein
MQDIEAEIRAAKPSEQQSYRERLAPLYAKEQEKVKLAHEQWKDDMTQYRALELQHYRDKTGQAKNALDYAKGVRELEGEGATPLTPEQRKQYGIPEALPAFMNRRGEIKFGPAGTTVNVGDKSQGKGDERLQEKLSESFIKTFEEGNTAGDDIKQYLGNWGIKSEGLSEIQALQAGISRLIPQQRVPGSGTSSDFDGGHFQNSVVGLSKTPEGNALIFDTMEGLAKNKLARADVAGRVVSGDLTRSDGVREMLGLQREAKELSDKVKIYVSDKKGNSPAPALPSDDQMRDFVTRNPNHPKANEIRKKLGM